jgi:transposase-like protein
MPMDRVHLMRLLAQGLSLERIGEQLGRDATTVGYWVRKHGLTAVHRDRHAPKGGITRERLQSLVDEGRSIGQIAAECGVSRGTVRHWLEKHNLRTKGASRRREHLGAKALGLDRPMMNCPRHGLTEFWMERRGHYRCRRCRSEAVTRRRRKVKDILVREAGGSCRICGYDRYQGALEFHHLDPREKDFGLSTLGVTRSIARAREEARKCILVCANCHAEVEAGLISATLRRQRAPG